MSVLPLTVNTPHKPEMEYYGKVGHTFGMIQKLFLMSRTDICYTSFSLETQTVAPFIYGFQVSISVYNIWIVTHIKQSFILILTIMAQMSSDLYLVGIKLKTTQPTIV